MLKHTVYKHFAKNKPKWIFSNAIALVIYMKYTGSVRYLCLSKAAKKWTMPIQNWKLALQQFHILLDTESDKVRAS